MGGGIWVIRVKREKVGALIKAVLCSLAFAVGAFANVLIEGDSTSLTSSIGDTISIAARNRLHYGENLVRWELVSGQGMFVDAELDSTGFIPLTDSATIRMVTRVLPIYEMPEEPTKFTFDKNCSYVPYVYSYLSHYGIRFYIDAKGAQSAHFHFIDQNIGILNFGTDSTFTKTSSKGRKCYNHRCFYETEPNTRNYILLYPTTYPNVFMRDTLLVWQSKTHSISASHTGKGVVSIDSMGYKFALDSVTADTAVSRMFTKVMEDDSVKIYAVADSDYMFSHWETVSGSCDIENAKSETTRIMHVLSDCNVKAVFRPGEIYNITATPTLYNFTENYYARKVSHGHLGVRFIFVAPSTGTFKIVVSNNMQQDSLYYLQYKNTTYETLSVSRRFLGSNGNVLDLTAGDTVAVVIYRYKKNDNPFYISYATLPYKLTLGSAGNGKAVPDTGYADAYAGSKYSIGAVADSGYRFSNWKVVFGAPAVDDLDAPYTFAAINGDAELKAVFKQSQVYTLTSTKQTFNFQDNYYSESTKSAIRFTWTPPDTNAYVVRFEPVDSLCAFFRDYGDDKTFKNGSAESKVKGSTSLLVKGAAGEPLYWSLQDSTNIIPDKSFKAWISTPYKLNVESSKGGLIHPSGEVSVSPGTKTVVNAWPHGGYRFKNWASIKGDFDIDKPNESRTTVFQEDSVCSIRAVFTIDTAAQPSVQISKLDLNNYPQICAQVSVTDLQNGHAFNGLTSRDLVLTEDGQKINAQVTSIQKVTGISVALVVDQSSSMKTNDRMSKAIEAMRDFVDRMGPYDRTAIIGFVGTVKILKPGAAADSKDSITIDSVIVHQTMTANKSLLQNAIDSIKPNGSLTNIISGTYVGVSQVVNEINPTAVIVFSDGANNCGWKNINSTIEYANMNNTNIYSIALESDIKYPLLELARNTGGTFSMASDASELAGLYTVIRENILSQYLVCYQTPDTLQDGQTHDVAISMTFNKITASDTAQWSENSTPPMISLTDDTWKLIENTQSSNIPLTLGVYIKSMQKLVSADVYLRTTGSIYGGFSRYPLTHVSDSLWEFTVPANLVVSPGLDFYVTAVDSLGLTGKAPRIPDPSMEPYTIFIDNDIPIVERLSVACEDSTTDIKTFTFRISDSDGIDNVVLYYKDSRDILFQTVPMEYSIENDTWNVAFHASSQDYSVIHYYLRASDGRGATVRYLNSGYSVTGACEVQVFVPDSIPENPPGLNHRDSIEFSLIADKAEIYDSDLDGKADFVRIHFNSESDNDVLSIDSIFWNSNRGEWRYAEQSTIAKNGNDAKWIEANINEPFRYGLTMADSVRVPYLSFMTSKSTKLENVALIDKVGAVPVRAVKRQGKLNLEKYMDPHSKTPPDTLVVMVSEPIRSVGDEDGWMDLFRYSTSCDDTATYALNVSTTPKVGANGLQWTLVLDDFVVKTGFCLRTNPNAAFEDGAGNAPGRGGVEIKGMDGAIYITEIKPLQSVSGVGNVAEWISPGGFRWEELPDTLSAIRVNVMAPYTADIYIFDGISVYVNHMEQKFGYDGEMSDPLRENGDRSKQSFLYWDQQSNKGRKVGTGVYIWRINFTFDDGHKEIVTVRTGVLRRNRR